MKGESILSRARRGDCLKDLRILDAHAHIGNLNWFPLGADGSAEGLLQVMDRVGIERLCVTSTHATIGSEFRLGNDEVAEAVRRWPQRFFGYTVLYGFRPEGVLPEIHRCEKLGMRGIKIHSYQPIPYTAAAYHPAYEYANEKRIPILAHTWGKPEIGWIRELAKRYPNIRWLMGHSGVVDFDDYVAIAKEVEHAYLELAFSFSHHRVTERFVSQVGADKVLWGSDACFLSASHQIGRVVFADISDADKRKILGANARRVLGIE